MKYAANILTVARIVLSAPLDMNAVISYIFCYIRIV